TRAFSPSVSLVPSRKVTSKRALAPVLRASPIPTEVPTAAGMLPTCAWFCTLDTLPTASAKALASKPKAKHSRTAKYQNKSRECRMEILREGKSGFAYIMPQYLADDLAL